MQNKSLRLGEVLFEEGLIKIDQLHEALEMQKKDSRHLGKILLEKGWIDAHELIRILAAQYQLPYVPLSDVKIPAEIMNMVSYDLMQTYKIVPIDFDNNYLTIATNNPQDISALQDIQVKCGCLIKPVMSNIQDIEKIIQEYSDSLHSINAIKATGNKSIEDSPVINLVDALIRRAIKERASDIHFEPLKNTLRVRFRIDGVLYQKENISKELERNIISRVKIISGMDVAESRRPQDGRTSFVNGEMEYDIRISTLPNSNGESLVLRILSKEFAFKSLELLGMDPEERTIMNRLLSRPHGLFLVTGPTGAGKTTTLYAMLNILNKTDKNIISVEDPIEYEMEGVNQTSVNPYIDYKFSNSIRHILRHDPDIIMVGEIRDVETAQMAIRAALTGHLVISTMHTNTAVGAITRLLEMNIEPFLISSAINGVISQRLVRQLCPDCKKDYEPDKARKKVIQQVMSVKDNIILAQEAGCSKCLQTGYQGRLGVFELLNIDEDIKSLILKSADEKEISQKALSAGMKRIKVAGMHKVIQKKTTMEELLRIIAI
ncbi:MAG: GspE/PulE family protein [Candidatus Omnitrophica bacterium]|nr:GspE/PulE family protein [Candidatus Omnitrophota bacterium]